MNATNFESSLPATLPPSLPVAHQKPTTASPDTVTYTTLEGSDGSSSQVSIRETSPDPALKSILKARSAYTAMTRSGKIPSDQKSGSVTFSEGTKEHDGKKITPTPSVKSVPTNTQARPRRTAPPAYVPEEYIADPALEKTVANTGKFFADGLRKASIAITDFIKHPEDFFIPDQPKNKAATAPADKRPSGRTES